MARGHESVGGIPQRPQASWSLSDYPAISKAAQSQRQDQKPARLSIVLFPAVGRSEGRSLMSCLAES